MARLKDLYTEHGQSPWLDNIRREWITDGTLEQRVSQGVRGITSNPTIFEKAITSTTDYDGEFTEAIVAGATVESAYWQMVVSDVVAAATSLRDVYDTSDGLDGFVSLEVSPNLAYNSAETITAARRLHERISLPNLYVKIPATTAGLTAIRELVSEKLNVNVTLIFGVERYLEVAEAYISGLEQADGDLRSVVSVASFFISRIDTVVDRYLEQLTEEAQELRGKVAVATAKEAYSKFQRIYSGSRWDALAARGARPQRLLWASTSTKNPDYPDTVYVDELIGPQTVTTLPDSTLDAFEHHGTLKSKLATEPHRARAVLKTLKELGIDMNVVSQLLEKEGVTAFSRSFNGLLDTLSEKAASTY